MVRAVVWKKVEGLIILTRTGGMRFEVILSVERLLKERPWPDVAGLSHSALVSVNNFKKVSSVVFLHIRVRIVCRARSVFSQNLVSRYLYHPKCLGTCRRHLASEKINNSEGNLII